MKKIKSFMMMTMAAMAFVCGMSSCSSSDDDAPETPVADQLAGSYAGVRYITIMGDVDDPDNVSYQFTKTSDSSVDMIIPKSGESGMMVIPALTVKNIPLKKNSNVISGEMASYNGTVTGSDGNEKSFTITNLAIIYSDKDIAVSYTLKYGNMPFDMETVFTGSK